MPATPRANNRDRSEAYHDIKSELTSVKEGVSTLAHDAKQIAKEGVDATLHQAKKAVDRVQSGYETVCTYAKEHPTTAILVALGVGAIIGRLMARKF